MNKILSEPDYQGDYLKPDKVKVGDKVRIESVAIEPEKEIQTDSGPATIPTRVVITGYFVAKGQSALGQSVKVSLSKGNEKRLYQLWGDIPVGKEIMVTSVQRKNIKGRDTTWIDWMGLP
jgi:hypothetical protein